MNRGGGTIERNKILPKLIPAVLIALILISGGSLLAQHYRREQEAGRYEEIAEQVEAETETVPQNGETAREEEEIQPVEPPYIPPVDFDELEKVNSQVVGWLRIPGTKIDYPILHDPEDNQKYLHTDLEGNPSQTGSIYLDCDDEPDFSSRHNVIYGHHMKNGTMFKDIVKYRDSNYWEEHSDITVYLKDREIALRPLACLYTTPDGIRRKTAFGSEEVFQTYVSEMTKGADVFKEPEQEIKTLYSFITCSYEFQDARTILYCYEIDKKEKK